jgi:alpha-tubulin suppressor-like RCC1 family protein
VASTGLALGALDQAPGAATVVSGGIYGWGDNSAGVLGNPSLPLVLTGTPSPVPLPGGVGVRSMSTTQGYTLALATDGNVYAWGDNSVGELGDGSPSSSSSPVQVSLPVGVTATSIATSSTTALAIGSDGNVYAWGDNTYGQLGQGTFGGSSSVPVVVHNPVDAIITAVAAGTGTMMELTSTGVVYQWGYGQDGELGNGGYANIATPEITPILDSGAEPQTVAAIAVGQEFCVVATTDGTVYTWGYDGQGELGDLSGNWTYLHTYEVPTPTAITLPAGGGAVAVSAGAFNGYALTDTGQIDAWGDSDRGNLGDGPPAASFQSSTPVAVDAPPDGGTYTALAAGADSVSALTSDGNIDTWGVGASGQLGNGTTTLTSATPVQADLPTGVTASGVSSGGDIVYAVTDAVAPAITSADQATFVAGQYGSFPVTATGLPTPDVGETGALPSGLQFTDNDNGTATISGTPDVTGAGPTTLTLTAHNGFPPDASQSFTLIVDAAPSFTSAASTVMNQGLTGSFEVTTQGYPDAVLTAGPLPAGLVFTDEGNGTALIAGTPSGPLGIFTTKITATNGVGAPVVQHLVIKIHQAPAFTSADTTTFTVDLPGTFTVITTGAPVSALGHTGRLPTGVTFVAHANGTATLAGTPAPGTGGIYDLTFSAANPFDVTQDFVLYVNGPPVFTSPTRMVFVVGQAGSHRISVRPGYPGPVTLSSTSVLPGTLALVDNGNGTATISGTPTGPPRWLNVAVTATNGGGSTVQHLQLAIEGPAVFACGACAPVFHIGVPKTWVVGMHALPQPRVTATGLPGWLTLSQSSSGVVTLSGTAPGPPTTVQVDLRASSDPFPSAVLQVISVHVAT